MSSTLTFESVYLEVTAAYEFAVADIQFTLAAGESLCIELDESHACPPLADAALGLMPLARGEVRFEGRTWEAASADELATARSRIRRIFEDREWVSNLDLDENITLAERHHTNRPVEEIVLEATEWGKCFKWQALPTQRPTWVSRHDRMIGQWVRALLGQPALLLLERPSHDVDAGLVDAFVQAVETKRKSGAAIVWLTSDTRLLSDKRVTSGQRARILEGKWEVQS
jgi:phospholipid/cholesterol/gamma-HCH transport system ATP-binding protein